MIRILFGWLLVGQVMGQSVVAPKTVRPQSSGANQRIKNEMTHVAQAFLATLSNEQRQQAVYALDDPERFVWYYTPHDRKGLPLKQMNSDQRLAALALLKTGLSDQGYEKATGIMDMENVLRVVENKPANDTYRDPDNYYVTIFGNPDKDSPWSWRIDGHHLSLQFMSQAGLEGRGQSGSERILAQTPTFFGSNPGIVRNDPGMADKRMADPRLGKLPQYGKQLLRQETERAFALLKALTPEQLKQVVVAPVAYPDILTGNKRSVVMDKMDGLQLGDMTASQRALFLELLQTYLSNYRITLANQQLDKLRKSGLDSLRFAWAGDMTPQLGNGKGWYYRIHGPTILIEYDNTQSDANHIHTVVRDLTNDFGEDLLQEHYRTSSHKKP
ncbi:DUF3500 domain-containing protein [Spirosoma utsteinense]|uniref:DUF3500 domain-containing protein n=1 Tax=Spirosoma utsteinense TaxID=2585773 RepID=A0ABR6W455_9BACT|nr:DUF3500 domain-containing protein [Spirosoma utsteinense]MBC3784287.1 hypothetical protein [Spirosoma utsteinense]MBC3790916.1 hypothetical protein [Spirosoma utsteinense]